MADRKLFISLLGRYAKKVKTKRSGETEKSLLQKGYKNIAALAGMSQTSNYYSNKKTGRVFMANNKGGMSEVTEVIEKYGNGTGRVWVAPFTKSDGTKVKGHWRSL